LPTESPSPSSSARRWSITAAAVIVAALAVISFLGPGTDLDSGAVILSGRAIRAGDYVTSRPPGAPVHEAAVGVLEGIGGVALSNLGSLVMAVVAIVALLALLRRHGVGHAGWAAAFVVANPWFLIAATSTVDFVWAIALVLVAAVLLRRGSPWWAGLAAGLAVGCRMSTILLVGALVVAEMTELERRRLVGRTVRFVGVTVGVGVLCFVPAYVAAGRSLAFAQNDFATSTPFNHLGRFAAKDLALVGPFAAVALVIAAPAVWRSLRLLRTNWLLRFGLCGLALTQLLFLRFPWKMGHLLPSLVCLAIVLAVALDDRRRLFALVVAAQALLLVANIDLVEPDNPNLATRAHLVFQPRLGVLVTDVRCRAHDTTAYVDNDRERTEAVWNCAKPFGTGP
jgi:hypothetical protein